MVATLTVEGTGSGNTTKGASTGGSSATSGSDYKTVDAAHQRVVKEFLAGVKTAGIGNQPLKPTVEAGVPVYDLSAKVVGYAKVFGGASSSIGLESPTPIRLLVPRNGSDKIIARLVYTGLRVANTHIRSGIAVAA